MSIEITDELTAWGIAVVDEAESTDWSAKIAEASRIMAIGSSSAQAVTDQWDAIRAASEASVKQIEDMGHALRDALLYAKSPITYTNREARRARARNERKRR